MKNFLILIAFMASSALIIYSCSKDDMGAEEKVQIEQANESIETLGSVFSQAINENPEFRKLIRSEASIMFDYQYDVLFEVIRDMKVQTIFGKEETVLELLGHYSSKGIAGIEELNSNIIDLQISIPTMLYEKWDGKSQIPVAFIPVDLAESRAKYISTYFPDGTMQNLSAKEAPEFPVLVVSQAERVKDGLVTVGTGGIVIPEQYRMTIHDAVKKARKEGAEMRLKSKKENSLIRYCNTTEEYNMVVKDMNKDIHEQRNKNIQDRLSLKKKSSVSDESVFGLKAGETGESSSSSSGGTTTTTYYVVDDGYRLKSATTDGEPAENPALKGFAGDYKSFALEWDQVAGCAGYKVEVTGPRYETSTSVSTWIASTTSPINAPNKNFTTVNVEKQNSVYSFRVIPYNSSFVDMDATNKVTLHSSARRNNGTEYIYKVVLANSTVKNLEGWWASEIELKCKVGYTNSSNVAINETSQVIEVGADGMGGWGDWTHVQDYDYNSGRIFDWDRISFTASYTAEWYEVDGGDNESFDYLLQTVGLELQSGDTWYEKVVSTLIESYNVGKHDDKLGDEYSVLWWDEFPSQRTLVSGLTIYWDHN